MLERIFTSLRAWACAIPEVSPGGRVLELDGTSAAIVPALPDRSVANCVVYGDADRLAAQLDEIAAAYDEAGVRAWTVWAHETDRRAERVLVAAGHVHDSEPMAMLLQLGELEDPPEGELDLIDDPGPDDLAAVMREAYATPEFGEAVPALPPGYRLYAARVDGEPAACLAVMDVEGDATVTWVGTVPAARGRGLATRLLHRALDDARERGIEISTLEATRMGYPVYRRLGYRDLGRVNMWERRKPA